MTDIAQLTTYRQVGNALVNSEALLTGARLTGGTQSGFFESLEVETAVVYEASYGQGRPCMDSTPAPTGLNVWIKFNSYGFSGLTFTQQEDIGLIMKSFCTARPEDLIGKPVKAYVTRTVIPRLVGLEAFV